MNFDPQRAQKLFHAVLELTDPVARQQLLDRECAGDAVLRQRVEALIRAHDATGGFVAQPSGPVLAATVDSPSIVRPGVVVAGRYKLLEAIGEGGMGTVWVAEQTEPVRRKVAVKLIKAGLDSQSVLARFEAERQALAMMDHPNIAKVLDGGLTEAGRPFFVMEYVKGVPITEYCDATRMSIPERLTLFVQVCQAVQHAHQKGIIHRDLKPSNILVAPYDHKPVPKVIDFGLAKAMHQSLTERTLHTAHDMVLGTPLYMSPEQAQLNNLDVDTRSDIYSLGVVLYELLTGTTPLEKQRFKEAAWDEVRRIIREEEPPPPSTRLSSNATLASLADGRQTEPARLTKLVRGELDWIAMKALEKDRGRRYESATALARDVERFLADEVVEARPPSMNYRVQKFVRRHKGQVVAVSLILLAFLGGAIGTTYGVIEAGKQRETQLLRKQAEQERDAAQIARTEAEIAREAEKIAKVAAEQARDGERQSRTAAESARDDLAKEREKLARVEYGRTIQVAYEQCRDNNIAAARELLEGTRKDLRGWEWHYLHRLCHADLLTLHGHTARIQTATWSEDGTQQVISVGEDNTVRRWDATTGDLLTTHKFTTPIRGAWLWTNGSRMVSGDYASKVANVWDTATGTKLFTLRGHSHRVLCAAFNTDASLIATGSEDKTAIVWNGMTGDELIKFRGHSGRISAISFSPDGSRVISSSEGDAVKVWNVKTGDEILSLKDASFTTSISWTTDGSRVVTTSLDSNQVKVWDVTTGTELISLVGHEEPATCGTFSHNGKWIATASHDRTLRIWDASTGLQLHKFLGHTDTIWSVAWNLNDTRIVTSSSDLMLRIWDSEPPSSAFTFAGNVGVLEAAAYDPTYSRLVTGGWQNTAKIWDAKTGIELLALRAEPRGAEPPLGNGEVIYVGAVSFSPDGSRIVTGNRKHMAKVWDAQTGKELFTLNSHAGPVNSANFSPDGSLIVTASHDKTAKIWDAKSGTELRTLWHDDLVMSATWSPDSLRIVTASHDKTAKVWHAKSGSEIAWLRGHSRYLSSASFSSDGSKIVTAGGDHTAKIWDANTGAELRTLTGHTNFLTSASFSHDGRRIVTGSWDKTAKIWDTLTGADLLTLKEIVGQIQAAYFFSDDSRILARSGNELRVLDARPVNREFLKVAP